MNKTLICPNCQKKLTIEESTWGSENNLICPGCNAGTHNSEYSHDDFSTKWENMKTKDDTPKVGIGIAIVVNDKYGKEILLGKRKGSHASGKFSMPGGHLEIGETIEECTIRELKEETGFDATDYKIEHVDFVNDILEDDGLHYVTCYIKIEFNLTWSMSKEQLHELKDRFKNMEPDKNEGWKWFTLIPPTLPTEWLWQGMDKVMEKL